MDNFMATFSDPENNKIPSTLPDSFFGLLASLIAKIREGNQIQIEDVYYSFFILTAAGVSLDRVVAPTERDAATKSSVTLKWVGTPGEEVPGNSLAETAQKVQFATRSSELLVDIGGGVGEIEIISDALKEGPSGNVPDGAITFIPIPIPGVDSVTNELQSTGGDPIQDDISLKEEAIEDRNIGKTSSLIAIENAVDDVVDVSSVFGVENTGIVPDGEGRPSGSYEITVRGGTDLDVATAILTSGPTGVETFGDIAVIVTDSSGRNRTINFSRPSLVEIWVRYELKVTANYDDNQEAINKQRCLDYIGGVNPEFEESSGLNIGTDVLSYKTSGVLYEQNTSTSLSEIVEASSFLGTTVGTQVSAVIDILSTQEGITDFVKIIINKTVV
jgi:uncharacterized phage protein gp47/JayE